MATASLNNLRSGAQTSEGPNVFERLLQQQSSRFDPDAYHVMQQRDDQLIEDELLYGVASKKFVYDFKIQSTRVTGVSVVGARQLASEYGGIKSRIVATVEKRGALFIFRSFEPLNIHTAVLHELSEETDFYECIMQVDDIKTGNSIQVRKKEAKTEKKSVQNGGGSYDRPHYDVISESKAFRNGVLSVLPQSVIEAFKQKHLTAGNTSNEQTIAQRREGVIKFAGKHGIALQRDALAALTFAELDGLKGSIELGIEGFMKASGALGLIESATGEVAPPAPRAASPAPKPEATRHQAAAPAASTDDDWTPSPEEEAEIRARELAESAPQAPAAAPTTSRRTRTAAPAVE